MNIKSAISALLLSLAMLVSAPVFASDQIDINSASAKELAAVKGIGPKLSQAIVTYRQEHGAFHNIDELAKVHGIGEKNLAHIRARLTAAPAAKVKKK